MTTLAFRLRAWIIPSLYLLGFLAPWQRLFPESRIGSLWLEGSGLLARTGWMDLEASTLVVTVAALCCLLAGALLRLWGAAYLGAHAVQGAALRGDRVVASGPYRYLRNPLYLGSWLLAAGVSILMPLSGALFFLVTLFLFQLVLISREEDFLSARFGEIYQEYRRRVPRLLPRLASASPASQAQPLWPQALLAEIYPVGFTLCFAILAWRYNVMILIKCLLVCYGLSLIARAIPLASQPGQTV